MKMRDWIQRSFDILFTIHAEFKSGCMLDPALLAVPGNSVSSQKIL
jgi:hypothetical protein